MQEANHYTFHGPYVSGAYDATTITGHPGAVLEIYGGSPGVIDIDAGPARIELRALVSATADQDTVDVVVVLPVVHLDEQGPEPEMVGGYAVITTHRTGIGGPRFVEGALESYELVDLEVEAGVVVSLAGSTSP